MNRNSRTTPVATYVESSERTLQQGPRRQGNTVAFDLLVRPGEKERIANRKAQNLLRMKLVVADGLFCTNCGSKRVYRGDNSDAIAMTAWLKTNKCKTCKTRNRKAGTSKFCRKCKTVFSRGDMGDAAWASAGLCETHRIRRR